MSNNKFFGGLLGAGAAAGIATAVVAPAQLPTALLSVGAALAGASTALEYGRKREASAVESAKVAKSFSHYYEVNKGLVNPQQLGFTADIPVAKAEIFLDALADSQGGQKIQTEQGVVFNFPHPQNVLEQLTTNATAWATSQRQPLEQENMALKQQLSLIRAAAISQQRVPPVASNPPVPNTAPPGVLNNPEERVDPWSNLL